MSRPARTGSTLRRGWVLAAVVFLLFMASITGVFWWLSRDQLEASVHRIGARYRERLIDAPWPMFINYLNGRHPRYWRWIDFEPSNVDDVWFREHRRQLRTNGYLSLLMCNTEITAQSIAELHGLPNVQMIDFTGTQLDDAAVHYLADVPYLSWLSVAHTGISDSALADLSRLLYLRSLWIDDSQLTPAGVAGLAKCRNLRNLVLFDAKDERIDQLIGLTQLETISVRADALSSASLPTLSRLQDLQGLVLYDDSFSDSEIAQLKSALQGCTVVRSKHETVKESREKSWKE